MRSGWASLLVVAGSAGTAAVHAQTVTELGLHALMTTAEPTLAVGGLYAAVRPSQRLRVALTTGAGIARGDAAARGELLGHFLLNPSASGGVGAYAGGGVAGVVGAKDEGYVVLLIGVEARPGRASGWALEAGIGGGLRIAAGYRWRRHPRPHRRKRNRPGKARAVPRRATCGNQTPTESALSWVTGSPRRWTGWQ
jgi:hypothetical protein